MSELADRVEIVFDQHYRRTSSEMSSFDYALQREGLRDWERAGDPAADVIGWTVEVDEQPALDLQTLLAERHSDFEMDKMGEETEFAEEAHYARRKIDDIDFQLAWKMFEQGLKTRGRFFNRDAEARLLDLFGQIHTLKTDAGQPIVREVGPETDVPSLYRSRVFQAQSKLEEALINPERWVGSPESRFATAGRMNAKGISVFYGATDAELTLIETRPPIGSRAILGRFDLLRSLKVLDVEALEKVLEEGSLFDPTFIRRLERAKFLERLAARIRMPVMPDDEGVEYLATQAMAEYLADRVEPRLDGIMYGSAQGHKGAKNVALFNHAAQVAPYSSSSGATYSVWTTGDDDDGSYPDYAVWEEQTSDKPREKVPEAGVGALSDLLISDLILPVTDDPSDYRLAALRLDRASLEVRHIRAISLDAPAFKVRFRNTIRSDRSPF